MKSLKALWSAIASSTLVLTGLAATPPASAASITQLDVVNAYTPAAASAAGGVRGIEDLSATSIAAVNTAMARSSIPIHVNLVGSVLTSGVADSSGESAMLKALSDGSSNFASAKALRKSTHAHALMLFIKTGTSDGGLSAVNKTSNPAFSVGTVDVAGDIATHGINYAHEFGHVLGADHDLATAPSASGSALGFADPGHGVRDIMSYSTACDAAHVDCTLEDAYSDPNLIIDGHPMGNARANIAGWMTSHVKAYAGLGQDLSTIAKVTGSYPAAGAQHVSSTAPFSVSMTNSVNHLSAHLEKNDGSIIPMSIHWNPGAKMLTFTPNAALTTNRYRLVMSGDNLPEQTIPFSVGYGASALRASGDRATQTVSVMFSKSNIHLQDSVDLIAADGHHVAYMASGYKSGSGVTTYTLSSARSLAHGTYTVRVHDYVADGLSVAGADRTFTVTL